MCFWLSFCFCIWTSWLVANYNTTAVLTDVATVTSPICLWNLDWFLLQLNSEACLGFATENQTLSLYQGVKLFLFWSLSHGQLWNCSFGTSTLASFVQPRRSLLTFYPLYCSKGAKSCLSLPQPLYLTALTDYWLYMAVPTRSTQNYVKYHLNLLWNADNHILFSHCSLIRLLKHLIAVKPGGKLDTKRTTNKNPADHIQLTTEQITPLYGYGRIQLCNM